MTLLNATQQTDLVSKILSNVMIVAIILLLYGVYYFFFRHKKESFQKYIRQFLLHVTFFSGLVVYFIGYQFGNPHGGWGSVFPNLLESVFSTTRLFILGNDLVEINNVDFKHNPIFHAMFSLTSALAAFIFISFIAQVFFKNWIVRERIKGKKADENHFFFGINQSTLSLSTDLLKKSNRLVVFINDLFENENQHLYSELSEEAYVLKRKSFFDSISLEKEEGLFKLFNNKGTHAHHGEHDDDIFYNLEVLKNKIGLEETHLYLLTDDDDWNIEYARKAIAQLTELMKVRMKDKKWTGNSTLKLPIRIHVATYNEISEKHFTKSLEKKLPVYLSVVVHNYATLVSRQLIKRYHPVDFIGIDKEQAVATTDFNTMIIGFGQIGTHVLRKLIEQGQFVGSKFKATVIDRFMHVQEGRFEHLYPGIIANYDVDFIETEVGHRTFYETVRNLIDKTNYIVIALGQDELNIQTALEILEINGLENRELFRIFIQLEDESHWKSTLEKYKSRISIFGESDEVFTEQNILQRDVEISGRLVHQVYNVLYDCNYSFDEIERHDQLSNISAAEHLFAKVKLLGYDSFEEFSNKFNSNNAFIQSLKNNQELNLSIGEHLRWNSFHFIHGWTTLPMDHIPGNTPDEKYKKRKNSILRIHSCLISWEDLVKLEKVIGKDMQMADTDSVRHLYDFINAHNQNTHEQH